MGAVQTIYSQLDFNFELCCGFADANQGLKLKIPKTHFDWIDQARIQKLQLPLQLLLVSSRIREHECFTTLFFVTEGLGFMVTEVTLPSYEVPKI